MITKLLCEIRIKKKLQKNEDSYSRVSRNDTPLNHESSFSIITIPAVSAKLTVFNPCPYAFCLRTTHTQFSHTFIQFIHIIAPRIVASHYRRKQRADRSRRFCRFFWVFGICRFFSAFFKYQSV